MQPCHPGTMRWWPERRGPEPVELHPGVPPLADWDEQGIVGTIGTGPDADCTVVASAYRDAAGTFECYDLWFPDGPDRVTDASGGLVVEDGVVDDRVPGVTGGLVDALTRAVDVTWWGPGERARAFWAEWSDWFPEGRYRLHDPFCQEFLVRLRELAKTWDTDVTPGHTTVETMVQPLAVSIEVPGTTGWRTTLWMLCSHEDGRASSLRAWWGSAGVVDDGAGGVDAPVELIAPGDGRGAGTAAALAARWFEQQLRKDVHRRFPRRVLVRSGGHAVTRR